MAYCKTAVTPLLTQWSYYSLALSHRSVSEKMSQVMTSRCSVDRLIYDNPLSCNCTNMWLRRLPKVIICRDPETQERRAFANYTIPNCSKYPPLPWRHNERHDVSNHQPRDCLLNRLFRRRSKKTPKLRITGLWAGNSPVAGEFPAQMASNAENISIWWRHHAVFQGFLTYQWPPRKWASTPLVTWLWTAVPGVPRPPVSSGNWGDTTTGEPGSSGFWTFSSESFIGLTSNFLEIETVVHN